MAMAIQALKLAEEKVASVVKAEAPRGFNAIHIAWISDFCMQLLRFVLQHLLLCSLLAFLNTHCLCLPGARSKVADECKVAVNTSAMMTPTAHAIRYS